MSSSSSGGNSARGEQQKKIDDAMAKLDELAKRQQELAQQPRTPQNAAQQRYQQDQLRSRPSNCGKQIQAMQQQQGGQQQRRANNKAGQQASQSGAAGQGGQTGTVVPSKAASNRRASSSGSSNRRKLRTIRGGRTGNASAQQLQQTLDQLRSSCSRPGRDEAIASRLPRKASRVMRRRKRRLDGRRRQWETPSRCCADCSSRMQRAR